ncbi:PREDICTED: AP-5 complex subunit zeta-1 isoform X2 [Dipodomys ordii]|uniref:AP-5 complex subunit zeta-1 isoform X2 n=1 Tax=Dipodomys ordii TaxID=10020 RepID=A0A1S3FQY5_DIPOR|nr:PREDICTED: AP-5 complex subunit zeta-1 isoform X2 [Dipodomys ordii]
MFTAAAENLLHQAREIQDEELGRFCAGVSKLLQEAPGPATVDALQRLFLIVSATKYPRRLEKSCVDLLQTTLCQPSCPEQLQVLCAAILREMSPSDSLTLSCEHAQNTQQLSLVASVLLAQGDRRQEVRSVGQRICTVLESRQLDGSSPRPLLPIVSKTTLTCSARSWWTGSATPVSSRGLHTRGASSPHPGPGSRAPSLRWTGQWPQTSSQCCPRANTSQRTSGSTCRPSPCCGPGCCTAGLWTRGALAQPCFPTDDRSELEGSTLSVLSAASTASRLLPPRERLREVAFEYCQRLLEQSNRRALRKGDSDLQKACVVEAVLVVDVLCRQEPSFLYRALSCLKALHAQLGTDEGSERALLALAQFFLNHGEAAVVGADAVYQRLFTRLPAEHFHSPVLAFEVVRFCVDNLGLFPSPLLGLLKSSFPNLFKLLAWHSAPLTSEFVVLLPGLVDASLAVEMLHALLDLPCLTAALDLQLRNSATPSDRPLWDTSLRTPSCLEAFRSPQFQGLFQHLLRTKASGSVERLTPLHQLLQPMSSCARVVQCAQAVPTLLHAFFAAVTQFADGALTNQLALLILERSDSLYQVAGFEARVHRVLSGQLLVLCQQKPALVVELARELLGVGGSVSSIRSHGSVLTCVVWAVGEYLSVACDRRCTVEQINKFFEALEALLFEVTQSRPSADLPRCPPQVITGLMTTLTKLASRSQDLIPRVSLFLSKMRTLTQNPVPGFAHQEEGTEAIRTRATELLTLLKMPSVAQFVFTPSADVCHPRYHRDTNTALPLALRTVSRLVEKEAGQPG